MKNIIKNILLESENNLKAFDLDQEDILYLLEKSKNDLEILIEDIENIINSSEIDTQILDEKLHALKGILLQVGSISLAKEINMCRSNIFNSDSIKKLKELLEI